MFFVFSKDFFGGRASEVEWCKEYADAEHTVIIGMNSIVYFESVEDKREALKLKGNKIRGHAINVKLLANKRVIVCLSGFDSQWKVDDIRSQILKKFMSVLGIFIPTSSKTGSHLGFGYVYLEELDSKDRLRAPIAFGETLIDVRKSTLKSHYLAELVLEESENSETSSGVSYTDSDESLNEEVADIDEEEMTSQDEDDKENVSEIQDVKVQKTALKKVLLPIYSVLHDSTVIPFSWEIKRPGIIPRPCKQSGYDCWAHAYSRVYNALFRLNNIQRPDLTHDQVLDGVDSAHQVSGRGIDRLRGAAPFMKRLGCDVHIHNRPRGDDMRDFEEFEKFVQLLLEEGPVIVTVVCTPGFLDFDGEGIYRPTDADIHLPTFEKFQFHCLLLTAYGVKDGVEYWRVQETNGEEYGDGGFIFIERHKCLIKSVVQLKIRDGE